MAHALRRQDVDPAAALGADALRRARSPRAPAHGESRSAAYGSYRVGGPRGRIARIPRVDGFRRVLRVLQLFPRRVRARAGGVVLPARRRAAGERSRAAPRGRVRHAADPPPLRRGRIGAGGHREPGRRGRRGRVRRGDDGRSAHLVVRGGRHEGAHASRLGGVAPGRRGRSGDRRPRLRLVDAPRARTRVGAKPAGWQHGRRNIDARLAPRRCRERARTRGRDRLCRDWRVADRGRGAGQSRSRRRVLRRGRVDSDRVSRVAGLSPSAERRLDSPVRHAAWFPQHVRTPRADRVRGRRDRIGRVHPRVGRRVPAGCRRRGRTSFWNGRLSSPRGLDAADRPRSEHARRP